jgi:hypothetical protein
MNLSALRPALALLLLLAVAPLRAAWEDTGTPARAAPASRRGTAANATRRPAAKAARRPAPAKAAPTAARKPAGGSVVPPDLYSSYLDTSVTPRRWVSLTYIGNTDVGGSVEDISMGELAAACELLSARNVLLGDLELNLRFNVLFFGGDAGQEILPTALVALPLDLSWTWRFVNGSSFQAGARPGIYADAEALGGGMFALPFRLAWYHVLTPQLSVVAGAELRPGWDLVFMPILGVAWEPVDYWRLEVGLPCSRTDLDLGPVTLFGLFEWRNASYAMSGEDGDPDSLTSDELLLSGGVRYPFSDSFNVAAEAGLLLNRSLTAEGDAGEDTVDLGSAPFLRLTFGGSF